MVTDPDAPGYGNEGYRNPAWEGEPPPFDWQALAHVYFTRLSALRDVLEACPCYHDRPCPYPEGGACTCGMSAWLDRFNGVLHA
jgi:hypothetical protein